MHPEQIVADLRARLGERAVTFFLVYAYSDPVVNEIITKITSNSTTQGISAIMSLIMRPTEEAVQYTARTFAEIAATCADRDCTRVTEEEVAAAAEAARAFLDRLRALWTVQGWQRDQPSRSA